MSDFWGEGFWDSQDKFDKVIDKIEETSNKSSDIDFSTGFVPIQTLNKGDFGTKSGQLSNLASKEFKPTGDMWYDMGQLIGQRYYSPRGIAKRAERKQKWEDFKAGKSETALGKQLYKRFVNPAGAKRTWDRWTNPAGVDRTLTNIGKFLEDPNRFRPSKQAKKDWKEIVSETKKFLKDPKRLRLPKWLAGKAEEGLKEYPRGPGVGDVTIHTDDKGNKTYSHTGGYLSSAGQGLEEFGTDVGQWLKKMKSGIFTESPYSEVQPQWFESGRERKKRKEEQAQRNLERINKLKSKTLPSGAIRFMADLNNMRKDNIPIGDKKWQQSMMNKYGLNLNEFNQVIKEQFAPEMQTILNDITTGNSTYTPSPQSNVSIPSNAPIPPKVIVQDPLPAWQSGDYEEEWMEPKGPIFRGGGKVSNSQAILQQFHKTFGSK